MLQQFLRAIPRQIHLAVRRVLIMLPLPAQQFRLGVAFSSLVSMVAAHTAPPSGAACTAINRTASDRLHTVGFNCRLTCGGSTFGIELGPSRNTSIYASETECAPRRWHFD